MCPVTVAMLCLKFSTILCIKCMSMCHYLHMRPISRKYISHKKNTFWGFLKFAFVVRLLSMEILCCISLHSILTGMFMHVSEHCTGQDLWIFQAFLDLLPFISSFVQMYMYPCFRIRWWRRAFQFLVSFPCLQKGNNNRKHIAHWLTMWSPDPRSLIPRYVNHPIRFMENPVASLRNLWDQETKDSVIKSDHSKHSCFTNTKTYGLKVRDWSIDKNKIKQKFLIKTQQKRGLDWASAWPDHLCGHKAHPQKLFHSHSHNKSKRALAFCFFFLLTRRRPNRTHLPNTPQTLQAVVPCCPQKGVNQVLRPWPIPFTQGLQNKGELFGTWFQETKETAPHSMHKVSQQHRPTILKLFLRSVSPSMFR